MHTAYATLVCHRDRFQVVKEAVQEFNRQNMVESLIHPTVERPWGHYTVMEEAPGYKVKRIEVHPGSRLIPVKVTARSRLFSMVWLPTSTPAARSAPPG